MADKLDLNKPVQTRDGRPVRILCTNRKSKYPIVGLVLKEDGSETTESWLADGGYHYPAGIGENDLVNVPPKPVKYYVDVFSNQCGGISLSRAYTDKRPDGWLNVGSFIKTIEFDV